MVSRTTNLDMDVLRTFVTGLDLGSFAKAAERLGRSQSAVSLQLKKLEEQTGESLLRKDGRGLAVTPAGETMLAYARRLLELNDEAVAAVRGVAVEGWVRLGIVQDFAESWLPGLLGRFARAHPGVRVEARVDRGIVLLQAVERGELDLAIIWGDLPSPHRVRLAEVPIRWIGADGFRRPPGEPLSLVAFEPPCPFRKAGIEALDQAGIPWRVSFTSPSLAGLWAAVEGGLGVTPRTREGLPGRLRVLDGGAGLPELGTEVALALHAADEPGAPAVQRLRETLLEMLRSSLLSGRPTAA